VQDSHERLRPSPVDVQVVYWWSGRSFLVRSHHNVTTAKILQHRLSCRNEMDLLTGSCTVQAPPRCISRSEPTTVHALSLKALPSISFNVVPVLLPKKSTHTLHLYSSKYHIKMRCSHWRKSAATPVAFPSRSCCSRHSHSFQLFTDLAHEHQIAGVILGRARIPSCYFGSRVFPGKGLRRQSVLDTRAPATSILPTQFVDAHLDQWRRRQQAQHPMGGNIDNALCGAMFT
jgi:hypothetical protein